MRWAGLALAISLAIFGCNDGTIPIVTAPVNGTVMYEGKPLENYRVFFYVPGDAAQEPASGRIQSDGSFSLTVREPGDGAIVGLNQVWLKYDPPLPETEPGIDAPILVPPPTTKIPEKYLDRFESGLTVDVPLEGLRDYKIELE